MRRLCLGNSQSEIKGAMMKKIVHITFSDDKGGAAIAAYRLHRAMSEAGLDSKMVVFEKNRKSEGTVTVYQNTIESYLYKFKVYVLGERTFLDLGRKGYYSYFCLGNPIWNNKIIKEADVVYLHWINRGYLNCRDIEWLLKTKEKVIWIMHDMFPFTGGCHHALNCKQYMKGCGQCDRVGKTRSSAKRQYEKKKELVKYNNLYWVAPSKWLFQCAKRSKLIDKCRLYHIPNAISRNYFNVDKDVAKKALGLDTSKSYVLYGGDNVTKNPYKGFRYYSEMINNLDMLLEKDKKSDVNLLIFGVDDTDEGIKKLPIHTLALGEIRDERTMNLLYNASDVMVLTSIAENSPLVVQESVACDTPVVAFNVGGVSDFITDDLTGRLIPRGDTVKMAEQVLFYLTRNRDGNKVVEHSSAWIDDVVDTHRKVFSL